MSIVALVLPAVRTASSLIAVLVGANVAALLFCIVGGRQYVATDDHACNCSAGYQTAVGSAGEVTCSTDDFQGHDECGDGGTCYDPLLLSEQALPGEFSCYSNEGYELMEDGGLNGGDTCSPINCGSVSVNISNQCPSVELFLDDNVLVQCHDGYSWMGNQSVPPSQLLI